jgi:epoxyqueuosine reductase
MDAAPAGRAKDRIKALARALGFDAVGIGPAELDASAGERLDALIGAGGHGDMTWLAKNAARRSHPQALWPEARSVIALGLNYYGGEDALALLKERERGAIALYARGRDYHDVFKAKLKALARRIAAEFGAQVKVFVDTAPVMEKPLAERAGVGWQGKHTNLVSRRFGSWLFLGEILTDLALPPDRPESDHCGSCRRCLEICPTDAFPAPYRLDPLRCISYLTIEHKGSIPRALRPAFGNRIYGCDDCLAVCPWNRFAARTAEFAFAPRAALSGPFLAELARLDEAGFRQRFAGTAIKRIGRERFLRNVMIALGNSGSPASAEAARRGLAERAPLVRAMAVWALGRLLPAADFAALRARHAPQEEDDAVRAEWQQADGT